MSKQLLRFAKNNILINENVNLSIRRQRSRIAQLSPYDVNMILHENEFVINFLPEESTVRSYESNQLSSNTPCEDCRTEASLIYSNAFLCGVFDGHGGPACGQVVSKRLLRYISACTMNRTTLEEIVQKGCNSQSFLKCHNDKVDFVKEIKPLYEASFQKYLKQLLQTKSQSIETELKRSFERLDNDISEEALLNNNMHTLAVALSGAVACVAHIKDLNVHVASTGDCGAVIGTQCSQTGGWIPKRLNTYHNTENKDEVERIYNEHPPEEKETVIRNNRLLNQLAPLRAFGDFRYKWSQDLIGRIVVPAIGDQVLPQHYYTPPYLTATPEVRHHLLTEDDKFLVLASDGLWDFLSPSDVITFVGEHIASKRTLQPMRLPESGIQLKEISKILAQRRAGRTRKPVDQNAATHLIRNALGGTDYGIEHSKISYYLSLPKDIARLYRDDITITVVYFNTERIAKLTGLNKNIVH